MSWTATNGAATGRHRGQCSAALTSCAAQLGGVLAGADSAAVIALGEFGRHLGLAFQFTDDVLGIWGDPTLTGKPVGADIGTRKKSLPVAFALSSPESVVDLTAFYQRSDEADPDEIGQVTARLGPWVPGPGPSRGPTTTTRPRATAWTAPDWRSRARWPCVPWPVWRPSGSSELTSRRTAWNAAPGALAKERRACAQPALTWMMSKLPVRPQVRTPGLVSIMR